VAVVYGLINAVLISVSNVLGGVAGRRLPLAIVMSVAGPASVVVALIVAVLIPSTPTLQGIVVGFIAGVVGGFGVPIAYRAFAIGPMGAVGAVIAITTTTLLTTYAVATGTELTILRLSGLILCVISIPLLVSRSPQRESGGSIAGPVLALVAGALFTTFVIILASGPTAGSAWSIVGARLGVTAVAAALLVLAVATGHIRGLSRTIRRSPALIVAGAAGATDVLGNVFLLFAAAAGDLTILALLAPAAPLFTAIIGKVFLHETLTRRQMIGLCCAAVALILGAP
jgi:drug/metabolite transporter (DMT)-like permease